jgi:hypothetical protein
VFQIHRRYLMKKILAAAAKKALVNMLLEVAIKVLTA